MYWLVSRLAEQGEDREAMEMDSIIELIIGFLCRGRRALAAATGTSVHGHSAQIEFCAGVPQYDDGFGQDV